MARCTHVRRAGPCWRHATTERNGTLKQALVILIGLLVATSGYTFWYGQGVSYLSNDPAACKNCHIMNDHYDSWEKASHRVVATCNDCHTPKAFVSKYLVKAESGFLHSKGFTLNDFPEPIRIRKSSKAVLNANCVRCHEGLVGEMITQHGKLQQDIDCTHCHIIVGHGPTR
jgi:cytochrome c nitrite reductase small subunit